MEEKNSNALNVSGCMGFLPYPFTDSENSALLRERERGGGCEDEGIEYA